MQLDRRERLADAARDRLASQAQPIQPAVKEVLMYTLRTMATIARGAVSLISLRSLGASDKARDRAVLTVAR
jgi:hypothetical protein